MIPVEGHSNLFRDPKSGAIINNDTYAYQNYLKLKYDKQKQRDEIAELKTEVSEIKSLLLRLLNESK